MAAVVAVPSAYAQSNLPEGTLLQSVPELNFFVRANRSTLINRAAPGSQNTDLTHSITGSGGQAVSEVLPGLAFDVFVQTLLT